MHIGDHLLYINSVNVRGLGADQVGAILRQQFGHQLRLIVARPVVNAALAQQTLSSPSNSHPYPSDPATGATSAPTVFRRFVSEGATAPSDSSDGPFISPHAPLIPTAQLDETARMIAHSPDFYRALLLQQQLIPDAPPLEPQDTGDTAAAAAAIASAAPPNIPAASAADAFSAASESMSALKANSVCVHVFSSRNNEYKYSN